MNERNIFWLGLVIAMAFLGAGGMAAGVPPPGAPAQSSSPTPTYDPLAAPLLPERPTQVDVGRSLFYDNCMTCHGDRGQGLTDEFRQVWVEDHRNCWASGCHAGRPGDQGFPIPTVVPAVISAQDALENFTTPQDLAAFLRATHPPQNPGGLSEEDYQALTAFLWASNGKRAALTPDRILLLASGFFGILVLGALGAVILRICRKAAGPPP